MCTLPLPLFFLAPNAHCPFIPDFLIIHSKFTHASFLFYTYTRLFAFGVPFSVEDEDVMSLDDAIHHMRSQAELAADCAYAIEGAVDDDDGDFTS
jgi:hypothetical protein